MAHAGRHNGCVSAARILMIEDSDAIRIPVVTVIALGIPTIFGGAIITEQIFRVNGLGQLLITGIQGADIPLVQTLTFIFAILIVFAMGGIAMVAAGRGEPMMPAYDDRPDARVPKDRPITAEDLRRVRFSLALRGYRMSEVDALLALNRLGAKSVLQPGMKLKLP